MGYWGLCFGLLNICCTLWPLDFFFIVLYSVVQSPSPIFFYFFGGGHTWWYSSQGLLLALGSGSLLGVLGCSYIMLRIQTIIGYMQGKMLSPLY